MKVKTLGAIIYCLTFATVAGWLLLERRACAQIHEDNTALLRRLNEAIEKLAQNQPPPETTALSTENLSGSEGSQVAGAAGGEEELFRLRREIAGLLQQHQQAELLREDTRQTRVALENRRKEDRAARRAASGNVSQLEILQAQYWTDHTNLDVTEELQDRIRGDSLKAMANNKIKGDPEFGQTKHLTVQYRFGGVTRTNEFREGDVIVLPAE
jgi:hypothetical protein